MNVADPAAVLPPSASLAAHRTKTATHAELAAILDERLLTNEDLWLFVNYFREHGVTRPMLAERLGIGYLYLNSLLYGAKRVTEQFSWRMGKVLAEPLPPPPKVRKVRPPTNRGPAKPLAKVDEAARRQTLPYEKLVELLDKPQLTSADLWPIVNYYKSFGIHRPAMARHLGISHSHLVNMLWAVRSVSERLRRRVRAALAEPLKPQPQRPEPIRIHPTNLPDPVRDDLPMPEPRGGTLVEHLVAYALERPLADKTLAGYRDAAKRFGHWLGRPATIGDLTDMLVNRWLVALEREGMSKISQHGLRRRILVIWRHAFEVELATAPPMRVRKIRLERRAPRAWTHAEILKLLAVAQAEEGQFQGKDLQRAAFWEAFIRCGYDTGLRLGDLLQIRRDQFDADGSITFLQHKTGSEIVCNVWPETLAAIDAIQPISREFIFGGVLNPRYFLREFRRLVVLAGLKGSSKWLRRSGATAVEQEHPGSAGAFLGHRTPGLAMRHYVDPRQVQQSKPRPPRLGGGVA